MLSYQQAKAFYDRMGAGQDSQAFYEDAATEILIQQVELESASGVFEFGCGTGRFAEKLLDTKLPASASYVGVDISPTMIGLAESRLNRFGPRAQVRLSDGSIQLADIDTTCDRIVSNYVLDLLSAEDARRFAAQAAQLLSGGGLLGLVSLTHGFTPASRLLERAWTAVYHFHPMLVGGCRPISLTGVVSGPEWTIRFHERISRYGVPSEILVAARL